MEKIEIKLSGENSFPVQEAYKVLRTNLQFCGEDTKIIAITSCNENEGKTTVTLNIAKSFAELGKRTLVIDADMRKSVMAGRNTDTNDYTGLSEVLSNQCDINDCIHKTNYKSLHLLFAGKYPPNPVELLGNKRFSALLSVAKPAYDYIIIDTPPLGEVIDAAVIASKCDGVLLVIGDANLSYKKAQAVVEQLRKSDCHILGVVRNNVKAHSSRYYRRHYYK
ncbi:MAG: CpsD/CapB family tyrosine-protein kinase [Candidatus Fimenecus sp.]